MLLDELDGSFIMYRSLTLLPEGIENVWFHASPSFRTGDY